MMTLMKRALAAICLIVTLAAANQAEAWHGPRTFSYHGYGFGTNHHSFRPSIYNPGWSSYSRASFYSSGLYGGGLHGCWPRASYHVSYRFAPVYYSSFYTNYYPTYYPPACYYPTYYNTFYTPVVAPVYYNSFSIGFPTCSVTQPATIVSPVSTYTAQSLVAQRQLAQRQATQTYAVQKPVSSVPFRLASQPTQQAANQLDFSGRYVAADAQSSSPAAVAAPVVSNATLDSTPAELLAVADSILAAGGYRQAAQAYAQLVVKYGNSDRLVTRRFVAQVANGDYEQAAVVIDLAVANGNQLDRADLPQGDLSLALGQSNDLIAKRIEGLAANALAQSNDAVPMLAVAHWLALSGDDERANLFKARAAQLQQTDTGIFVTTR